MAELKIDTDNLIELSGGYVLQRLNKDFLWYVLYENRIVDYSRYRNDLIEKYKKPRLDKISDDIAADDWGVHIAHCCKVHGCKYNDEGCPVVNGLAVQKYPCIDCDDEQNIDAFMDNVGDSYNLDKKDFMVSTKE